MPRPPKLTDLQREKLSRLEPRLREASRTGDFDSAKRHTLDIQNVLRPTGHETRLQRAKNWLFQAALEAGDLQTAISGFEGVRQKVSRQTRVYLEATVLLAITHLRARNVQAAEPLIRESLTLEDNIKSDRKREQFRVRVVERLELEYLLALLADDSLRRPDVDEVHDSAADLIRSGNDDDILAYLGRSMPARQIEEARRLYAFSRKLLPPRQQRLLPSPKEKKKARKVGGTVWEATKRVVWRALCNPKSDLYKMWFDRGVKPAADYRVVAGAVTAALAGANIGYFALAASASAFVIKMGVEVFCESTEELGIMIARHE